MSLFESGESEGTVSFTELFDDKTDFAVKSPHHTLENIAFLMCRGGWPGALRKKSDAAALLVATEYYEAVTHTDISKIDDIHRDAARVKRLMRSFARHQGTQASLATLAADISANEAEAKYNELIKDAFLVNENGEKVEGDAFAGGEEGTYPVFVANIEGKTKYIMSLHGAGLWGPLWGYISVDDDKNTVFGADFSHQGETPGLGAEIATEHFQNEFLNKKTLENGEVALGVVKFGKVEKPDYQVDGISGGTITSVAVDAMIKGCLSNYKKFLTNNDGEE